MDPSFLVLKSLLEKDDTKKSNLLLSFLSIDTKNELKNLKVDSSLPLANFTKKKLIEDVHYSWILPILEKFPKKLLPIILHSVENKKLAKLLKTQPCLEQPKKIVISFFKNLITNSILENEKDLIPKHYLPSSPLNQLLDLKKESLVRLIDFLAIYDLSHALPKIVEKKSLTKIYSFLSPEKLIFLKSISSYKEPFSFPSLNIKKIISNEKNFKIAMHKRALIRFSEVLSMQNKNLFWYLTHKLDIGRGETLITLCKNKKSKISTHIIQNILSLLPKLKEKTNE